MLTRAKVRTGQPLMLARAAVDRRTCELLVLEYLEGPTLLECLRDAATGRMPVWKQHAIAHAIGVQMSDMGCIFNRDHKPSNLIVLKANTGEPEVAVIDCVGVRRVQVLRTERMLATLVIEPTGCGVGPRRGLMMRVLWSCNEELDKWHEPLDYESWDVDERPSANPQERVKEAARLQWREAAAIVRVHGDPRPRVNPLKSARES